MRGLLSQSPTWIRRLAVGVSLVAAAAVLFGLVSGADDAGPRSPRPTSDRSGLGDDPSALLAQSIAPTPRASSGVLPALPRTTSPNTYASAVAEIVLGPDQRDRTRERYRGVLVGAMWDGVPGQDRPHVEAGIDRWLPNESDWSRLHDSAQTAEFTVDQVWEPDEAKKAEPPAGAGIAVRTIAGTQTVEFVNQQGERESTSRPKLVTVIVVCARGETCALGGLAAAVKR